MEDSAAREVLDSLFQYLYDPSNIYEHRWEVGDLVVWDNIAVQHSRGPIPAGCRRRFRRVAIGTSTPQFVSAMRAVRDRTLVFSKKTT
jgi:taurine dioxygenase